MFYKFLKQSSIFYVFDYIWLAILVVFKKMSSTTHLFYHRGQSTFSRMILFFLSKRRLIWWYEFCNIDRYSTSEKYLDSICREFAELVKNLKPRDSNEINKEICKIKTIKACNHFMCLIFVYMFQHCFKHASKLCSENVVNHEFILSQSKNNSYSL